MNTVKNAMLDGSKEDAVRIKAAQWWLERRHPDKWWKPKEAINVRATATANASLESVPLEDLEAAVRDAIELRQKGGK